MNQEQYLQELKERLRAIPKEDRDEALSYCEEYFFEAKEENFQQAYDDLGSPSKFAAQIKADSIIKQQEEMNVNKTKSKSDMKSLWIIVLGILSLPISLPLAIAGCALLFAGFLVLCALGLVAFICVMIFFILSICAIILGVKLVGISLYAALAFFGSGLFLVGLGILFLVAFIKSLSSLLRWLSVKLGNLFNRIKGGKTAHE